MRVSFTGMMFGAGLTLLLGACGAAGEKEQAAPIRKLSPEVVAALKQCGGDPAKTDVRFARDVQPVFDLNCVACHQSGAAMEGLVLESGQSHPSLVGKPSKEGGIALVQPGDLSKSYLFRKISGTHKDIGGKGDRMPLGGQLDEPSLRTICQWIVTGAGND